MAQRPKRALAVKIPTWAAIHYPEDDSTGVIYSNRILDLSSCEENAEILIRWTKDTLVPARIIAVSDSLEELEDAIRRFDEDMDEDVYDSFTHQTQTQQNVQVKTFKEITPSQDTITKEIAATLTGQERPNPETASADTITPLQEPSSSDMSTQETPTEISIQEDLSEMGTETEAQGRAIQKEFLPASTEMDTQPASKETESTNIGIQTACSDPSLIEVGTQTESEKVSKDISTQTEPSEDQDLDNTSFPLLNLSEYLTVMDDPYVQTQHRMMKQVEDNKASLKRIHESVDKIETLLKKIVHQPREAEPYNSDGIEQSISAAARSEAASVCASAGNMLVPSLWTSTPKRSQTPAKIIQSSIFSNVDTLVDRPSQSLKSATSKKLPKSIFASVESLASSSSNSSSNQMSTSRATIQVAKSIFRSVDFLTTSDCRTTKDQVSVDNADSRFILKQQREQVNSVDCLEIRGEESFDGMDPDDDRSMEIGDMHCDESNIRNSEY